MPGIAQLIVRMAQVNPGWGYARIQGALANFNHKVVRGAVANVLKAKGIEPAPERGKHLWRSTFLKAHWKIIGCERPPRCGGVGTSWADYLLRALRDQHRGSGGASCRYDFAA